MGRNHTEAPAALAGVLDAFVEAAVAGARAMRQAGRTFIETKGDGTPYAAADEATIAARSQAAVTIEEDEDEGATPKNLVIPRPPKPQQKLPTPPAVAQEKAQPQSRDLIADFRTLLSKAGR